MSVHFAVDGSWEDIDGDPLFKLGPNGWHNKIAAHHRNDQRKHRIKISLRPELFN